MKLTNCYITAKNDLQEFTLAAIYGPVNLPSWNMKFIPRGTSKFSPG